jgi:hypothetical protein
MLIRLWDEHSYHRCPEPSNSSMYEKRGPRNAAVGPEYWLCSACCPVLMGYLGM